MKNKSIWAHAPTLEELNHLSKNCLIDHLEITFIKLTEDALWAQMPVNTRTSQPMRILHGGASAALAETVANTAACLCVNPSSHTCVGIELNVNHLKMVQSGFVIAKTTPLHLGRTTQVWNVEIRDEREALIAVSRLTVAVLEKKPAERRPAGP